MKTICIFIVLLLGVSFAQYPQNDPYHEWDDISVVLFEEIGAEGDWVECPEIPDEAVDPNIVQFRYCREWSSDAPPEELQTLFDTVITSDEVNLQVNPLSNWIVNPVLVTRVFNGSTENAFTIWSFIYYRQQGIVEASFMPN